MMIKIFKILTYPQEPGKQMNPNLKWMQHTVSTPSVFTAALMGLPHLVNIIEFAYSRTCDHLFISNIFIHSFSNHIQHLFYFYII